MTRLAAALEHELDPHELPPKHLPWVYCKNPACGKPIPWRKKTPSQYARAQGCCPECSRIVMLANQKAAFAGRLYGKTKTPERVKADIPFVEQREMKQGKRMTISDADYEMKIDALLGIAK